MKVVLTLVGSGIVVFVFLNIYVSSFLGSIYAANSIQAIKQGDGLTALKNIEAAERLSPNVSTYPRMEAEYLNLWIKASPNTRETLEPIISAKLKRALELNPLYFRHYLKTSSILRELGYLNESVSVFEEAVRLVPSSTELRNGLATLYIEVGRYKKAEEQLQLSIRLVDGSSWSYKSYYVAATMYEAQGNQEKAIAALWKSLEVGPASPLCYEIIKQLRNVVNGFDNVYHNHQKCGYLLEAES